MNMKYNPTCYIRMSVGLFTTITGLGRKNWRGGFREYYSGKNINFGIAKPISTPGEN